MAKTQTPIYGVLSQPLTTAMKDSQKGKSYGYIDSSHVQFLETGGAQVVPIDYRLDTNQMKKLLDNLNGVYIPGDNANVNDD
jgi:gamma-glutamyl-gamma-aminobutyrate hydrolase PuuD